MSIAWWHKFSVPTVYAAFMAIAEIVAEVQTFNY
jgi:hypothetical protein